MPLSYLLTSCNYETETDANPFAKFQRLVHEWGPNRVDGGDPFTPVQVADKVKVNLIPPSPCCLIHS